MTPEALLTPERRVAAKEAQDLRRARMGHRVLTDAAQIRFRFGVDHQRHAQNQLRAHHATGRPDAQTEAVLLDRIAHGLANQCKYVEAAAVAKDEDAKAEYLAKAETLQQIGKRCSCPETILQRQPGNAKGMETPAQFAIEVVWTGMDHITFMKCVRCELLFALEGRH